MADSGWVVDFESGKAAVEIAKVIVGPAHTSHLVIINNASWSWRWWDDWWNYWSNWSHGSLISGNLISGNLICGSGGNLISGSGGNLISGRGGNLISGSGTSPMNGMKMFSSGWRIGILWWRRCGFGNG